VLPGDRRGAPRRHERAGGTGRRLPESTDSWAEVLRSLRDRGVAAPVLAVGDGALGFWGALREVFPATAEQRCWVHKTANVSTPCPSASTATPRRHWRKSTGRSHAPLRWRPAPPSPPASYEKKVALPRSAGHPDYAA